MNKLLSDETLFEVAARTIETLGMMFLVPPEEAAPGSATAPTRAAEVCFRGPIDGGLVVAASPSARSQLAANMLGLGDPAAASPEQQDDALRELANVICGNLLPVMAGAAPVFHIAAPSILVGVAERKAPPGIRALSSRILVDAGVFELTFYTHEALAPVATG